MFNLVERAVWTGVQSGLAIVSVDALTSFDATAVETLLAASVAVVLSALKTFSQARLEILRTSKEG